MNSLSKTNYSQINTLIDVRSGTLLDGQQFEQLLVSPSISATLRILEDTRYFFKAEDLQELDKIEEHLMNNLISNYRFALAEAPDQTVVEVFAAKYIYHNLKIIFRNQILNQDLENLMIPIGRFSYDELYHIIQTNESSVIPQVIIDRMKHIWSDYQNYQDIKVVSLGLDMAYFDHLDDIRQANSNPVIDATITTMIDFYNVITVKRGLDLNKPRSFMFEMTTDKGSIPINELIRLVSENRIAEWFDSFTQLPYSKAFDDYIEKMKDGTIETFQLEQLETEYMYQMLQEEQITSNEVAPLLFYLYRKEMEITNLRLVLNGRISGISTEKIRERMRPVYD